MDIRSILVNVDLNPSDSMALTYASGLAAAFDAELIGIAADEPSLTFVGVDGVPAAVDFYAVERTEIERRLQSAEERFHAALVPGTRSQWHAFVAGTVRSLIDEARLADVVVTGARTASTFGNPHHVDLGQLVLGAGRPVIAVADAMPAYACDKVVIAWKDTREARRAVADALPLLKRASDVVAITISEGDTGSEQAKLNDLLSWLARHGVKARSELMTSSDGFVDVLESAARAAEADLVVAGGYGHSRMREWLFGGMTRNLIEATSLNRLLSN